MAAGLKLVGMQISAIPAVGWFSLPTVQLATAQWELILGFWLLSGAYSAAAWCAALATFVTFGAVSFYLGIAGYSKCGCFGVVNASPWHALAIDIAILGVVLAARPVRNLNELFPALFRAGRTVVAAALLVGVILVAAIAAYGSPDAAIAKLRGDRVSVVPSRVHLGDVVAGSVHEIDMFVINRTEQEMKVIGGSDDCFVRIKTALPVKLQPNEPVKLCVSVLVTQAASREFQQSFWLMTDDPSYQAITVRISGRLSP